jgi:alginate O-acetyltransferase complex protein AlgI
MLFNSIDFAIFLPIVFFIYWFIAKNRKAQNIVLFISSYIFYGWWDWRFLSLLLISSFVDYFVGLGLSAETNPSKRKFLLILSISVNIGFLFFFKYFNFFANSFVKAFTFFGQSPNPMSLNVILPIGISFYTFQTLSYSIDVYKRKFESTRDILSFFSFVSFFPQLVAGPIERASNLLPQFFNMREFDYNKSVDGMRQMLWGFAKKLIIADNCAKYVNDIFSNTSMYSGSTLFLGAVLFGFQIYCDFSGYSDIAIGTARLFGFSFKRNFAFPYFSRDIAEFWRRWHISLSTWFRDYLYIPLGGSHVNTLHKVRNIFIIFIVSGLWHGANWTFVIWGFLNAVYFLPILLLKQNRKNIEIVAKGSRLPSIKEFIQIAVTFLMTTFAWIFFRAESIHAAIEYIMIIFSTSLFSRPEILSVEFVLLFLIFILFFLIEWIQREYNHPLERMPKIFFARWSIYFAIIFAIILLYPITKYDFIYFQF